MKQQIFWLIVAGIVGANAPGASARPVEFPGSGNMRALMAKADMVFRGKVMSVEENGEAPANSKARISVEKIYKGTNPSGDLEIVFDASNKGCVRPISGERALFLIKQVEGKSKLLDCQYGKLKAVQGKGKDGAGLAPEESIAGDLEKALDSADREEKLAAIQQLAALSRKKSAPKIKNQLTNSDLDVRYSAHWALIKLGDYSQLDTIGRELKKGTTVSAFINWNLGREIGNIADKKVSGSAETLTRSDNPVLVQAGVRALRNMKDPRTASRLVELLDSQDRDVAYDAMAALDGIKNGELSETPSTGVFMKDPDKYLRQFKDWWLKDGKKKFGQ